MTQQRGHKMLALNIFYFLLFIWLCQVLVVALGVLDLHCSTWDFFFFFQLRHVGSSSLKGDGTLHWEHRVLATDPPEKFPVYILFKLQISSMLMRSNQGICKVNTIFIIIIRQDFSFLLSFFHKCIVQSGIF